MISMLAVSALQVEVFCILLEVVGLLCRATLAFWRFWSFFLNVRTRVWGKQEKRGTTCKVKMSNNRAAETVGGVDWCIDTTSCRRRPWTLCARCTLSPPSYSGHTVYPVLKHIYYNLLLPLHHQPATFRREEWQTVSTLFQHCWTVTRVLWHL